MGDLEVAGILHHEVADSRPVLAGQNREGKGSVGSGVVSRLVVTRTDPGTDVV